MHLSMYCPTTPLPGARGVMTGGLTGKSMPHVGAFDISVFWLQYANIRNFWSRANESSWLIDSCMCSKVDKMAATSKQVLVPMGSNSRVIKIQSDDELKLKICSTFADIPRVVNASKFVIQLKDEEWGGEFVDLREDQEIPDRSILNVIPQVRFSV